VEDGTPESEAVMAKISVAGGPSDVTATEPETAVEATESETAETSAEPETAETSAEPESAVEVAETVEVGVGVGEDSTPDADAGSVELPRVNDPKAAWVEYAMSKGWTGDPDEVTKAYLIETYGE
jgi:hypothetical protein